VAWTNDGSVAELAVRAPTVAWSRATGGRILARDAGDGVADGVTRVPYGPEPVFVRFEDHG